MVRLKGVVCHSIQSLLIFQFHYGTIKSAFSYVSYQKFQAFQFHYGTIKSFFIAYIAYSLRISIPLWYD